MSSAKSMCLVQAGLLSVALPLDKGLQLVRLLQDARHAEADYGEGYTRSEGPKYDTRPMPEINMSTVRASQLRPQQGDGAAAGRRTRRSTAGSVAATGGEA